MWVLLLELEHSIYFCCHSDFLEPAYVGYILAPTEDQRLSFSHRLHVHGKRRVYMPSRMKELVKAHEVCLSLISYELLRHQYLYLGRSS